MYRLYLSDSANKAKAKATKRKPPARLIAEDTEAYKLSVIEYEREIAKARNDRLVEVQAAEETKLRAEEKARAVAEAAAATAVS